MAQIATKLAKVLQWFLQNVLGTLLYFAVMGPLKVIDFVVRKYNELR